MATYLELHDLWSDDDLQNKIRTACAVAANDIIAEDPLVVTNGANRKIWAKYVFEHTAEAARNMTKAVLAANKNSSVAQITGASDATIQNNVNAAVDIFADGTQKQTPGA